MFALVILITFFLSVPGYATDVDCATLQNFADQQLSRHFKFVPQLNKFACPSNTSRLVTSLYYIYNVNLTGSHGETYTAYERLRQYTKTIRLLEVQDRRFPWAGAMASRGHIDVFPLLVEEQGFSVIASAALLMHENRHNMPSDPEHQKCIEGENIGKEACDKELAMPGMPFNRMGAYSEELFFYGWIIRSVNSSPGDKFFAQMRIYVRLGLNFNQRSQAALDYWNALAGDQTPFKEFETLFKEISPH